MLQKTIAECHEEAESAIGKYERLLENEIDWPHSYLSARRAVVGLLRILTKMTRLSELREAELRKEEEGDDSTGDS